MQLRMGIETGATICQENMKYPQNIVAYSSKALTFKTRDISLRLCYEFIFSLFLN